MNLSDEANNLLREWKKEVDRLYFYGDLLYSESLRSLANMLVEVISLGGDVYTDGDMLIAKNDFVTYGVTRRQKDNGVLEFTIHS